MGGLGGEGKIPFLKNRVKMLSPRFFVSRIFIFKYQYPRDKSLFFFEFGIRKDSQMKKHDKVCLKSSKSVVFLNICDCYRQKTCSFYTFVFKSCEKRCIFKCLGLKSSKNLWF